MFDKLILLISDYIKYIFIKTKAIFLKFFKTAILVCTHALQFQNFDVILCDLKANILMWKLFEDQNNRLISVTFKINFLLDINVGILNHLVLEKRFSGY